jgi:hypothetical protein
MPDGTYTYALEAKDAVDSISMGRTLIHTPIHLNTSTQERRGHTLIIDTSHLVNLPKNLSRTLRTFIHPLRLASTGVLRLAACVLDREDSALDRVDQDVLRLEVRVVAPGAEELDGLCLNLQLRGSGVQQWENLRHRLQGGRRRSRFLRCCCRQDREGDRRRR